MWPLFFKNFRTVSNKTCPYPYKISPAVKCWNLGRWQKAKLEVRQERPCGLMDKASVSDTGDCKFESCQGRQCLLPPIESELAFHDPLPDRERCDTFCDCKNSRPWESACHWGDKIYSNVVLSSFHPVLPLGRTLFISQECAYVFGFLWYTSCVSFPSKRPTLGGPVKMSSLLHQLWVGGPLIRRL